MLKPLLKPGHGFSVTIWVPGLQRSMQLVISITGAHRTPAIQVLSLADKLAAAAEFVEVAPRVNHADTSREAKYFHWGAILRVTRSSVRYGIVFYDKTTVFIKLLEISLA